MKERILNTEKDKVYCYNMITQAPLGEDNLVTFKKVDKTLTTRMRNLVHQWYDDVAKSGLGSDDVKEDVKIRAKWMFAKEILLRDDGDFKLIFDYFIKVIKGDVNEAGRAMRFAEKHIRTEDLTRKQYIEYMKSFQRYWISKGANLTDPDEFNVKKDGRGYVK